MTTLKLCGKMVITEEKQNDLNCYGLLVFLMVIAVTGGRCDSYFFSLISIYSLIIEIIRDKN